jgi:hypothetical protein
MHDIIHDLYLNALLVQLPCLYGLQCWESDPQFTSTRITLLVNRRDRHLSTITLILRLVCQVCLQGQKVLKVTLTGMYPKYRRIYLLVVCAAGKPLAVDMAMLRALVRMLGGTG